MSVSATFRVDAKLNGTWTSLEPDLVQAEPLRWRRGMSDGGPLARVALPGRCEFTLRNDAGNSGSTEGWYSPNHASVRAYWTRGIPIRVVSTYGTDRVLWTGRLRAVDPTPGKYRERRVRCIAYDCMADLATTDVMSIAPQVDQTEPALIAAIIAALPSEARPVAMSYEAALDVYPYALDNATTGVKALTLLNHVVMSAWGYLYPLADGTLKYQNRQTRGNASSVFTFTEGMLTDLKVPSDLEAVYNRVRATVHPRRVDPSATTVLYSTQQRVAVGPGKTVEVWGDYFDASNEQKLIGGLGQVVPIVAGTDYTGNENSEGTGEDLTASVSVTTSAFAGAVKFSVTNNHGSKTAHVALQVRGKGVYDDAPVSAEKSTAQSYGEHLLEIDVPYQGNAGFAQDLAVYTHDQYDQIEDLANYLGFDPQASDALMVQALTGEIGQIVTLSETMTGLVAVPVAVQAIEAEVLAGRRLMIRYVAAPQGPGGGLILDSSTLDAAGSTLGYL